MAPSSSPTPTSSKILDRFLQTTGSGKQLNILGHICLATCLSLAAILLWNQSANSAKKRIEESWLQCPKPTQEINGMEKLILNRTASSCSQAVFYYQLLNSSALVSLYFGLIGAFATIYVGKEGLNGAKNFAINVSMTSIGIYSMANSLPASFNAAESLKCSINEYQSLQFLATQKDSALAGPNKPQPARGTPPAGAGNTDQPGTDSRSQIKEITTCQPSFKLDSNIFSTITNAFSSSNSTLTELNKILDQRKREGDKGGSTPGQ